MEAKIEDMRMSLGPPVVNQTCRVCLGIGGKMNSIFKGKNRVAHPIVDQITFCTGIQITKGDGLPTKICSICLKDLKVAYKFKTLCLQAEEKLKLKKLPIIKTEVEDKNYDNDCYVADDYIDEPYENSFIEDSEDVKIDIKVESNMSSVKIKREKDDLKSRKKVKSIAGKSVKKIPNKEKIISKKDTIRDVKKKPMRSRRRRCKLECDICNLSFQTKALYAAHNRTVHEKKTFMCEMCGKVFRHQSSQSAHKLTHQEPRYHCDNCDYRTFYKQDLVTHMRVHTGARNYVCAQCPLTFSTSSNRLAHVRRAHVKLNRFTCHVCGRGFVEKFELGRHLDTHQDVKRHVCEVCEGRFSRRSHLKRHLFRQHNVAIVSERCGRRRQYASQQVNNEQPSNLTPSQPTRTNISRTTQEPSITVHNALTSHANTLTSHSNTLTTHLNTLTSHAHTLTSQANTPLTSQANTPLTSQAYNVPSHTTAPSVNTSQNRTPLLRIVSSFADLQNLINN